MYEICDVASKTEYIRMISFFFFLLQVFVLQILLLLFM